MMQQLPVCGFQWVDISIDQVLATPDGNNEGYVVEVNREYPEHLHDTHRDYPLAPEAISVSEAWLGDYQRTLVNELGSKFTECVQLVPSLRKRERYVVHYHNHEAVPRAGNEVEKNTPCTKISAKCWLAHTFS